MSVSNLPAPALHVALSKGQLHVGSIHRRPGLPLAFAYHQDAEPSSAVSIVMPTTKDEVYSSPLPGILHPVFEMNLPEGDMKSVLKKTFAESFPAWDDCALLGIVGRSMIGRLTVLPLKASEHEKNAPPAIRLKDLLDQKNTRGLFASLLERYAAYSGVSGVQPKFLVREETTTRIDNTAISATPTASRMTAPGTTHIVKSADFDKFPGLVANEYLCLQAARRAGLTVPEASLSVDGALLAVKRFDIAEETPDDNCARPSYLGFEDMCALAGLRTSQKYDGSYEQIAKTIRLNAGTEAGENLAQFFKALVFTVAIRNGDAHRKNFGMIYPDPTQPARLAPTYDVLTTCMYDDNKLALTLDGTTKWPDRKRLLRFGLVSCGLNATRATTILEEVASTVSLCRQAWFIRQTDEQEALRHITPELRASLATAWDAGLGSLSAEPRTISTAPAPKPSVVEDQSDGIKP